MNIFLNRDGSCQKVSPSHIYQGSANVNTITVVAPYDNNTALAIAFALPNGTKTIYQPMSYAAGNQPGASDGVYFWTYKLPLAVTEFPGVVGVSINAVSATGNQTSYQCTFEVEESIVPTVPPEPDNDTWEALLVLYQQNAAAIAALAEGRVPVGDVTTETLPAGEDAEVEVTWDSVDGELDFDFKIPQGIQGAFMRFRGSWSTAEAYVNDEEYIDSVVFGGTLYICVQSHTSDFGNQPPNALYWRLGANGVASATASGATIIVTFVDGTTSEIEITGVEATVGVDIDTAPVENSTNLITSGGVFAALATSGAFKIELLFDGYFEPPVEIEGIGNYFLYGFVINDKSYMGFAPNSETERKITFVGDTSISEYTQQFQSVQIGITGDIVTYYRRSTLSHTNNSGHNTISNTYTETNIKIYGIR